MGTTVQQLMKELSKCEPNAVVMLGGMVIGGDPIDVEEEDGDEPGVKTVWLT